MRTLKNTNFEDKAKGLFPVVQRSASPRVSDVNRLNKGSKSPEIRFTQIKKTSLPGLKTPRNSLGLSRSLKQPKGRSSNNPCGVVKSYAVNSFAGHHHNEDRVNILINLPNPANVDRWPRSCYFSLFDGHSGAPCADFLKKNLYSYITSDSNFPYKSREYMNSAFLKADYDFLTEAKETGDMSGACALVTLFIGDKCVVANTGDSQCILSMRSGKVLSILTSDHKPGETSEYQRIISSGGKVYNNYFKNGQGENVKLGPFHVSPGKLLVSRAFGDIDAKEIEFGGNPLVVIADPHVRSFKIKPDHDFLLMANGGLFNILTPREIVNIVFDCIEKQKDLEIDLRLLAAISEIHKETLSRNYFENLTIVIIGLKGLKKYVDELI